MLDKQADVLFLGYNAQENYGFVEVDQKRFYEGNSYFYKDKGSKSGIIVGKFGANYTKCLDRLSI